MENGKENFKDVIMFVFNFYSQIAKIIATMQVKRYIVGLELWVNLPLVLSSGTTPARKPSTNKIMLFEKWEDFKAGKNYILVDVSKGVKLPVQTFESTSTQLMTAADAVSVLAKSFNIRVFYNGKSYFHLYQPTQSILMLRSSKSSSDAEKIKAFELLEKDLAELGTQVNKNAKLIAQLSKVNNLSPSVTQALIQFVNNHNSTVESFKKQTPDELKVLVNRLLPKSISGIGILPAIPAIVYWIGAGLAGAGLIVWGVSSIVKERERTKRTKALLEQQYKNLELLAKNPNNKELENAVLRANEQNAKATENSTKERKSMFDDIGGIVKWAIVGYAAAKIIPAFLSNKKAS